MSNPPYPVHNDPISSSSVLSSAAVAVRSAGGWTAAGAVRVAALTVW
ncbi:hypothetical protein [Streptomyces luteireticuli]